MKSALITLNGNHAVGDRPKNVKLVQYTNESTLISHLKELQKGYSLDGRDRPKIERHLLPSAKNPGKFRTVIDCYTYSDWHYVAHLGITLREGSTIPIEIIK